MSNIKMAHINGVLQDWDLYGTRFDIERVYVEVPKFLLESFTDEEVEAMCEEGTCGNDGAPLSLLFFDLIEGDFWKPSSRWEPEDPCELKLEVEYEEEA